VKKIPALLYVGKDLSTGPSVIFNLFPRPTSLGQRSQITEGPALRPFSYTQCVTIEIRSKFIWCFLFPPLT
jgi:hypothetical protein